MTLDDLDDDVLHVICRHLRLEFSALRALSASSRRLRRATLPFLYRRIRVRGDWEETTRTLQRLRELRVVRHARSLALHVHLPATTEQRRPPDGLPALVSSVLSHMTCLRRLSLDLPSYYAPLFGNQFRHDRLALKRVRSLTLAPYCDFAIYFCPNVTSVATNGKWLLDTKGNPAMRLLAAAGTTVTIQEFEADFDHWTVPLAEALQKALPSLRILAIKGQCSLPKILAVIMKLKQVEEFVLLDVDYLDSGRDHKRATPAEKKVAAVLGLRMKSLRTLRVGGSSFDIIRDKHGNYKGLSSTDATKPM